MDENKAQDQQQELITEEVPADQWDAFLKFQESKQSPEEYLSKSIEELKGAEGPLSKVGTFLFDNPASRAAIAAGATQGPAAAIEAFKQYSSLPPELAPSSTETAAMMGLSSEPSTIAPVEAPGLVPGPQPTTPIQGMSPAEIGALGVAMADPLTVLPTKTVGKGISTGLGTIASVARPLVKEAAIGATKALGKGIEETGAIVGSALGIEPAVGEERFLPKTQRALSRFRQGLEEAGEQIKRNLNPGLQGTVRKSLETAKKIGFPVELVNSTVLFGGDEFVSALEKFAGQSRITPGLENHRKAQQMLSVALDQTLAAARSAGKLNISPYLSSDDALGRAVTETMERAFKEKMGAFPVRYSTVINSIPKENQFIPKDKADEMIGWINSKITQLADLRRFGGTTTEDAYAASMIELDKLKTALQQENPSIRNLTDRIVAFQGGAYKTPQGLRIPPDEATMREMEGFLRNNLYDVVERQGSADLSQELFETNQELSRFLKDYNALKDKLGGKTGLDVYREIFNLKQFQSGPESLLEKFKIIGGEEADDIVNAGAWDYIQGKLKEDYSQRVAPDVLNNIAATKTYLFPSSYSSFQKNSDEFLLMMKNGLIRPEDLQDVQDILAFGNEFGYPILNPSGTAVAQAIQQDARAMVFPLLNESLDSSKKFADALTNRVATSTIIDNAKRKAIVQALDNPLPDLIANWGQDSAEQIAKLWATQNGKSPSLSLKDLHSLFQQQQKAKQSAKQWSPYIPTYTESIAKSLVVIGRLHAQGDTRPIEIDPADQQEVLRQIKNNSSLSQTKKVRNMLAIQNFGRILDLSPEEAGMKPSPKPGPRPDMKKAAAEMAKERKDVFKPEEETE
jgi:hypothetical protein